MVKFLRGMTKKMVTIPERDDHKSGQLPDREDHKSGQLPDREDHRGVCPDRETPKVLRRPPSGLVGTDPPGHQLFKSCSTLVEVLQKYTFSIVSLIGRPPKS